MMEYSINTETYYPVENEHQWHGAIERLCVALDCATPLEMISIVGANPVTLAGHLAALRIPPEWLLLLLETGNSYNPVWILTGKGDRYWPE